MVFPITVYFVLYIFTNVCGLVKNLLYQLARIISIVINRMFKNKKKQANQRREDKINHKNYNENI